MNKDFFIALAVVTLLATVIGLILTNDMVASTACVIAVMILGESARRSR